VTEIRGHDSWGAGHFGAPRGDRTHNGIDLVCKPGDEIECRSAGKVTKLGYPYGDDLSFRYVQITDEAGTRWRYFYVEPCVNIGDIVEAYTAIGYAQTLDDRYPGITEHIHFEIICDGEYIDPTGFVVDV
jgi:murein DD-endopeptidase MepM/ murein hydrolase activator NlpD